MDPASAQRPPDRDAARAPAWAPDGDGRTEHAEIAPPASRRRRRWAAGAAIVLVAAAAAAVLLAQSGSASHSASATGVPPGETTATVQRRTLTESSTVDGTLGYGSTLEIYDRLAGTFTWLPSVGAVIGRGGTLFRIGNEPVVLMYGSVPAYRTLELGVSDGPDVTQLNENLIDLGYDPYGAITEVERFSEATAAAVRRWQKAEGLSETGEVELGRVVFAPGARRVTAVHVVLGQDPPGAREGASAGSPAATSPTSTTPASTTPASTRPASTAPASKSPGSKSRGSKRHGSKSPASKSPASKSPTPKSSPSESTSPKSSPSKSSSPKSPASESSPSDDASADDGSGEDGKSPGAKTGEDEAAAGGGEAVLTTTPTQQLVQLKVKAEQQQLAHVGEPVPVTLPGGRIVHGRIIEVSSVASEAKGSESEKGASGESESATIPVTIALDHPVAHLDEAPVSVELVKAVQREVLTVPATALTATAGHGYAIEVLASSPRGEGDRRVTLAVTPGMFADGYVQVEGAGLREGMTVIESE